MAFPKMSLKLVLDNKAGKVLFAEASKEFVDFLFHIFSLPIGTLIELIGSKKICGLGRLKECIENSNDIYLQPDVTKDEIFNPKTPYDYENKFLLSNDDTSSTDKQSGATKRIYWFSDPSKGCDSCGTLCRLKGTVYTNSICFCRGRPTTTSVAMHSVKTKGNYVKEVGKYMVMDDLVVKPVSSLSPISFLKSIGVKDLSAIQEKVVSFEDAEALKLLKASLITDKVFTTVFL